MNYFIAILNFFNVLFCIYSVLRLSPIIKDFLHMRAETRVALLGTDYFIAVEENLMGTTRLAENKRRGEELIKNLTKDIRRMYRTELVFFMLITYSGSMCAWEVIQILESKELL